MLKYPLNYLTESGYLIFLVPAFHSARATPRSARNFSSSKTLKAVKELDKLAIADF